MLVEEKDALKESLKEIFGYSQFRGDQERVIRNLLNGKNTFVIMPTGAGKSLCYQLPAVMAEGCGVVVSPLIALMKDQVDELNRRGIPCAALHSMLSGERRREVMRAAARWASSSSRSSAPRTSIPPRLSSNPSWRSSAITSRSRAVRV